MATDFEFGTFCSARETQLLTNLFADQFTASNAGHYLVPRRQPTRLPRPGDLALEPGPADKLILTTP